MALEQYSNFSASTLAAQILSGASSPVTVQVQNGSSFPSAGNFRVSIESEIFLCTSRSGDFLTCTRAQEGTAAATHNAGAVVAHGITAGGLQALVAKGNIRDAYANRPSPALAGRVFLPTDGYTEDYDDGSNYYSHGPVLPFVAPVNSAFAWVNQGGAAITAQGSALLLQAPAGGGSDSLRMRVKTLALSSGYTFTVAFMCNTPFAGNFNYLGMLLRDSVSGKVLTWALLSDSATQSAGPILAASKWTSSTAFSAHYTLVPANPLVFPWQVGPCMWMRITDTGGNRQYSISNDGQNFFQFFSVGRTDFVTPDQCGFFISSYHATSIWSMTLLSLQEA